MRIGLLGLLESRKGTLCLMVLTSLTVLAFLSKIDGMAFSAGCTLISTIYCWTQHRLDLQANAAPPLFSSPNRPVEPSMQELNQVQSMQQQNQELQNSMQFARRK